VTLMMRPKTRTPLAAKRFYFTWQHSEPLSQWIGFDRKQADVGSIGLGAGEGSGRHWQSQWHPLITFAWPPPVTNTYCGSLGATGCASALLAKSLRSVQFSNVLRF
jgi:hypothetical protein